MTLFENRQSGDYEDFVYCDAELYAMLRPKTEKTDRSRCDTD